MLKSNMAIVFFKKVGLLLGYNVGENIKHSLQSKKNFVLSKKKNANGALRLCFLLKIHTLRCLLYTKIMLTAQDYPDFYVLELSHQN